MALTSSEIESSNLYKRDFFAFNSFPLDFSNIPLIYTTSEGKKRMCKYSSGLDDLDQYCIFPTLYIYNEGTSSTSDLSTWTKRALKAKDLFSGEPLTFGSDYDNPYTFISLDIKVLDENDEYTSVFDTTENLSEMNTPRIFVRKITSGFKSVSFDLSNAYVSEGSNGTVGDVRFKKLNIQTDSGFLRANNRLMAYAPSLLRCQDNLARPVKGGTDYVRVTARTSSLGFEDKVSEAIGTGLITVKTTEDESETKVTTHTLKASDGYKTASEVYGISTSFWSTDSHTVVLDTMQEIPEMNDVYGFNAWDFRNWLYEEGSSWVYGYIGDTDETRLSTIVLFDDWIPPIDGEDNITVRFSVGEDQHDVIDKCTFGALFGTSNAKNRLFVSGNDTQPNVDWHTGETGTNGDFTYFPDTSYNVYGQDTVPLVGYGMVSDGKLMAVKGQTDSESTIYYRTGTYTSVKDDYGNAVSVNGDTVTTESFPLTKTNSRIAGVKASLFTDFCGDSVFVTPEGSIVGMDNEGTTYDNQRVASTRTHYIDNEIRTRKASIRRSLHADGDRLYYGTDDGLYVSDYNLNSMKSKYEWFRTDIKGVMSHGRYIKNSLDSNVFGTYDGRLLALTDAFRDSVIHYIDDARVNSIHTISVDKATAEAVKDCTEAYITGVLTPIGSVTYMGDDVFLDEDCSFDGVTDGQTVWFHWIDETKGTYVFYGGMVSAVKPQEDGTTQYTINMGFYTTSMKKGWSYTGYKRKSGTFSIKKVYTEEAEIEIDNDILLTTEDNSGTASVMSIATEYSDIHAYYITAPMLTDFANSRKTVWSYTAIWDTRTESSVTVSKVTTDKTINQLLGFTKTINQLLGITKSSTKTFDFGSMDFQGLDMKKKTLPNVYTSSRPFTGTFVVLMFTDSGCYDSVLSEARFKYSFADTYFRKA